MNLQSSRKRRCRVRISRLLSAVICEQTNELTLKSLRLSIRLRVPFKLLVSPRNLKRTCTGKGSSFHPFPYPQSTGSRFCRQKLHCNHPEHGWSRFCMVAICFQISHEGVAFFVVDGLSSV